MDYTIDDMEHRVHEIIARNREKAGFPQLEDYGVTEDDFEDYIFYKQAVIDDVDSLRKKYTIYAIIFILPFVIMSFFETNVKNFLIGLGCGIVLTIIYYLITILVRKIRISRLHNEEIERYLTDVLKWEEKENGEK